MVFDAGVGGLSKGPLAFAILPPTSVSATVSNLNTVDSGQHVMFTIKPTGGSGVYRITWRGLPPGCTSENTSTVSCAPSEPGAIQVSAEVTDSNGQSVNSTPVLVQVNPALLVVFNIGPSVTITQGSKLSLSISVDGGTPPVVVGIMGLPPGCPFNESGMIQCTPTAAGDFGVTAWANDASGANVTARIVVAVVERGASTGIIDLAVIVGAIGTATTALVVVTFRRHFRRPKAQPRPIAFPQSPKRGSTSFSMSVWFFRKRSGFGS